MEGWRDGGMEGWRDGGLEGRRDGEMEGGGAAGRGAVARSCAGLRARLERRRWRVRRQRPPRQRREPAEPSGEFPLPRELLSQGIERDRDGSARGRGKRRQKWRWSEAGCRRTAGAAQTAPRESLSEAPASREEQTFWPAFVENPNPKDAEIFNRENKTIKNSQIIENIS